MSNNLALKNAVGLSNNTGSMRMLILWSSESKIYSRQWWVWHETYTSYKSTKCGWYATVVTENIIMYNNFWNLLNEKERKLYICENWMKHCSVSDELHLI